MDIKVGTVVKLKSGGPNMTVKQYPLVTIPEGRENSSLADCEWFAEGGVLKHAVFSVDAIGVVTI